MLNVVSRGRWRDTALQAPGPGQAKTTYLPSQHLTAAVAEGLNFVHPRAAFWQTSEDGFSEKKEKNSSSMESHLNLVRAAPLFLWLLGRFRSAAVLTRQFFTQ